MSILRKCIAVCLLLCLASFAAAEEAPQEPLSILRVHQIAIGSADAYLITCEDTVVLVDCGRNTGTYRDSDKLFAYLEASGIDHVDIHFVTHWHEDHALNIQPLSEMYGRPETVVYGPSRELPEEYSPIPNGCYRQLRDGDRLTAGPLSFLCVGPEGDDRTGWQNVDSLNILMTYGQHTFLFTGDWVDPSVRERYPEELNRISVLSFPHHGLKPFCISQKTMRLLSPRVILTPGNAEGDVKSYVSRECSVRVRPRYYCAHDGNVQVISDGITLRTAYNVKPGEMPEGKIVP